MQYFVSYLNISVWLATIIKKIRSTTLHWELWMLCQLFSYLREWGERKVMYWQLIGNIKHVKVIVNLHSHVQLQLSRGLEMVVKICNVCDKTFSPTILKNSEWHLIVSFFYPRQTRECSVNEFCHGRQSMYGRSHQL